MIIGGSWKDDVKGEEDGPLIGKSWKVDSDDPNPIQPLPLKQQLDLLTDAERYELFSHYCKHCGSKDTGCQCWNDE